MTGEWERIFNYPEAMQAASLLFAASAGGFCFKNEAQFFSIAAEGKRTAGFQYALLPFFEKIRSGEFNIPTRERLLAETEFVVLGGANYSALNYDTGESTLYPNTPKYGIIPLLPANLRLAERQTLENADIRLIEETPGADILAPYESGIEGDTYCGYSGGIWYYVNNTENANVKKTASFALKTSPETRITLSSEPHFSAMLSERDGRLAVYMNNYRTDKEKLNEALTGELSGGGEAEKVIAEWFTLDENGNPKGVSDAEKRKTVLKIFVGSNGAPAVVFHDDGEYKRPYVYTQSYDPHSGELILEIEHNGAVSFDVALPTRAEAVLKGKSAPRNREITVYDAAEYAEYADDLTAADAIIKDGARYSERSFYDFRNIAERLRAGIGQRTLSAQDAAKISADLKVAEGLLTDVSEACGLVASCDAGALSEKSGKAFDLLQRALYSPTVYVAGKENGLEIRKPYRKEIFDKKLKDKKVSEISKYVKRFKNALK